MDEGQARAFLRRMAEEASPRAGIPPGMVRRARRRRARVVLVGLLVLGLTGSGAFASLAALTRIRRELPAAATCAWTLTRTPNPGNVESHLAAVAAISGDDVWAVGAYGYKPGGYSPPPVGNSVNPRSFGVSHALTLHWDGRGWTRVTLPDPPNAQDGATLNGLLAISHDDVWATGQTSLGGTLYFEHWDGSVWSVVPTPVSGVDTGAGHPLAATGPQDVWFAGTRNDGLGKLRTLTMHWDGLRWAVVPSPNLGHKGSRLTAVAAVGLDDAWAVGVGNGGHTPLAIHWNGAAWSLVPMPAQERFYQPHDVAAGPDGRLVAVATSYKTAEGRRQTLGVILTWDGSRWRIGERQPGTDLGDVVAESGNDAWISGSSGWDSRGQLRSVLLHWDGRRSEREAIPAMPSGAAWLSGMATLPRGELWTVGQDPSEVPGRTLALHRPPLLPACQG